MPGIYRAIHLDIWTDEKVRRLSRPQPNGLVLWFYLLAAKESTIIPGVILAGVGTIGDSLFWPAPSVKRVFKEVEGEGLAAADWDARLIWIPKAITYNPPASPNVIRSWRKAWRSVPECSLRAEIFSTLKAFVDSMGEGFREAFREVFGEVFPGAFTESLSTKASPKGVPPTPHPKGSPEEVGGIRDQRPETRDQREEKTPRGPAPALAPAREASAGVSAAPTSSPTSSSKTSPEPSPVPSPKPSPVAPLVAPVAQRAAPLKPVVLVGGARKLKAPTSSRVATQPPPGALRDALDAEFLKQRGAVFDWSPLDETAVGPLLGKGNEAEILTRWRHGLGYRYPACNGIAELVRNWNAYAKPDPRGAGPPDIARGTVRAESQNGLHTGGFDF